MGCIKKSKKKLANTNRKVTEYGLQLKEKQKAKFIYGILEKQFRNYYAKAQNMSGMAGENLLKLLELRLDNVIYRLGFARTRKEARQIVSHNHVSVNGRKVNIPSYLVSTGDVVAIREKSKDNQQFANVLERTHSHAVPAWLGSERENLTGTVVSVPDRSQIDTPVNETMIVELYSR
jgi:small subunit ribosomal protein S4